MPTYSIRRIVGNISRDDVDAAAIRSLWCLANFPQVRWIRSTWDEGRGEINCLYEAPNVEVIREHAVSANLPCDEVREVDIIDPDDYVATAPLAAGATAGG
jgi:hypothetical protein